MNTLELFLANAGGENVEATHQRILAWLLGSRTVVKGLLGLEVENPVTKLEAHGKLFDIQVNDDSGERALIEIKMWAPLRITQQKRQQEKVAALKAPLYYFLFGISGFERVPDGDSITFKMKEVSNKLIALKPVANQIGKELGGIPAKSIISFLDGYANRLTHLDKWLTEEAWQPTFNKYPTVPSHFASLFYKLKLAINKDYANQYNPIIYRTGKIDVHLDLRKRINDKEDENQEVTIHGEQGTLVFWLKNQHLQIFFHSEPRISRIKALEIQQTFQSAWTGPAIDKVPSFRKDPIDWLCLLSVRYEPKEIKDKVQFDALVDFIIRYYDCFWETKKGLINI